MKYIFMMAFTAICHLAVSQSSTIEPGTIAPAFNLPNVNGKNISFANFPEAKGYIVVFTCNTCPVSKKYEQRIIDLNTKYAPLGYPVIAINPNDPEASYGDDFDSMKELARKKQYQFPYLYDKGQLVTNAYGAKATPHIFLLQQKNKINTVVYTGAIDNDPQNSNDNKVNYLENAITEILAGKSPSMASTKALGCTVKRKKA